VEDDKVCYWQIPDFMTSFLFTDLLTEIVDTLSDRDTERFIQLFDPFSSLWDELRRWNGKRVKWFDGDKICSRIREACSKEKSISDLVFLFPSQGNIKSIDVRINDEIDPSGELRRLINQLIESTKTAENEESDVDEEIDEVRDAFVDEKYSSDEEKEIDDQVQSNPEKPCYYPSQIEMAAILKKRIDTIMFHYHNIPRLSDAFDNVEFAVYTARYRMLSDQTEKRIRHPDAGVLSTEELKSQRQEGDEKKRMFMYLRSAETEKHFEELKEKVQEKPKTLFVIIADECHWGITKDKERTSSAHNLFINEWCRGNSPRNVIVVQISATPFNLLTQNSRLPVAQCVLLNSKMTTCQRNYEEGELVVLEREPNLNEQVRKTSKELELHVVHWSEVELKNFERGMQMKLKSTLKIPGVPYRFLQVSPDGDLRVTSTESEASDFIVQGNHGIVTLKVFATNGQQPLTVMMTEHGNLKATVDPVQPTTFEVKLEFGVGVVAFCSSEKPNHYIAVNEHEQVTLQAANVERKCGVSFMKPKDEVARVAFEFYIDQSGPMEVGMVGKQYMSLNHYLSTISYSDRNDQKIRQDKFFQGIVDKAKRQKKIYKTDKAKSDNDCSSFPTDALLCGEYCYHILHASVYHSDEKIRRALNSVSEDSPAAEFENNLNSFIRELTNGAQTKEFIHPEAFELVRNELHSEVTRSFKESFKVVVRRQKTSASKEGLKEFNDLLATSYVACLMHLSQQEFRKLREDTRPINIIEDIEQQLQRNGCQAMVEEWNYNIQEFETASLAKDLIQSGKVEQGKMKIVRAKSMETADQFFYTLRLARAVSGLNDCFEVIKDYGGIQIESQMMKSSSPFFRKLQPVNCTFKFPDCCCPGLKLQAGRKKCVNCQHVHKLITQYEDLENLACVLILVDKGRMGDTFPQSFDCLDLRLSYDSSREFKEGTPLFLSTLIQELGRMCRYAKVSVSSNTVQSIPYALVGRELFRRLEKSVETSPSMSAISCTRPDRYMTNVRRNKDTTSSSLRWLDYVAQKDSYDHQNEVKHPNRILLQAEPQIGKTGTYLCLIKDLRLDILGKEKVYSSSSTAFDEGAFYCYTDHNSSEEFIASGNNQMQDWEFPYWKAIQSSPSLHDKPVAPGKYSIGGRFYTHDTEENPYILMKREAQNQNKTSYYHAKTDCKDAKLRAWPWYHLENCGECGRLFQAKESVLEDLVVNIDGRPVTVTCSLPSSFPPYSYLLRYLKSPRSTSESFTTIDSASRVGNAPTLPYWIFHPSHRDDPRKCTLNYHHVMQEKGKVVNYVQVVVVRSEKFEAYRSTWGKILAIFQLPEAMPNCELGPSEGGVGYARLFIQKLAYALKLEYVFVIDDNVAVMSQAVFTTDDQFASDKVVVRDDRGLMKMERCSFFKPLAHLQKIAEGTDIHPHRLEPYPFKDPLDWQQFPLCRYTGPSKFNDKEHESYGVLGVLRSAPRAVNPFSKTQVYAAILLNVTSTVEKRVLYRPWPCWEDLRFNDDCDKEGLWVVKCNRFHFLKVQYIDWINSLALPSIFKWTDDCTLEERPDARLTELPKDFEEGIILEYLRKFVNSKDPEKCFMGSIGYDQQESNEDLVSPARIVQQIEAKEEAFVDGTAAVVLSYSVANRKSKVKLDLTEKFCSTKETFLLVTSAKEVAEECPQMTPATIPKSICWCSDMEDRNAQFAIFSAADPRRHHLRYILIEASFPQDRKTNEDDLTSITRGGNDENNQVRIKDEPNVERSFTLESGQDTSSESRGLERPIEESPDDPVPSKRISQQDYWMPATGAEQLSCGPYIPQNDREGDVSVEREKGKDMSAVKIKKEGRSLGASREETVSKGMTKVKRLKSESLAENQKYKEKDKHAIFKGDDSTSVGYRQETLTETTESNSSVAPISDLGLIDRERTIKKAKNKKQPMSSISVVSKDGEMTTKADNVLFSEADYDESTDVDDASNVSSPTEGQDVLFSKGGSRGRNKISLNIRACMEGTNRVTGIIVDLWREYKEIQGYSKIQIQERGSSDLFTDEVCTRLQDFTIDELDGSDDKGYTALLKACSLPSMSPHVMQYLITTRKVDLNRQLPLEFDNNHPTAKKLVPGMSALSVAIRSGNIKSVPTFMTRPGSIAVRSADHDGNTALHYCVLSYSKTSFQKLFPLFKPLEWKEMRNNKRMNPLEACVAEIESRRQTKGKERSLEYLEYMREEMERSSV